MFIDDDAPQGTNLSVPMGAPTTEPSPGTLIDDLGISSFIDDIGGQPFNDDLSRKTT